jgi:beta-alanine--pyruvate transaminase
MVMAHALARNDLSSLWMPFTANRQFKASPRLLAAASGMYYTASDGHRVLDGTAGLWCCNAGHAHPKISEAIARQVEELDFAPGFQMGHPKAFEAAARLAMLLPGDLNHVFFTNSGSESADTALKIAIAYHHARGDSARTRLIGRARGYHGVGFGGLSVGGIPNNRKAFGSLLPGVDHLPHTHNLEHNAFSRGQPEWGAHLADELDRIVDLHGASTIAAVIVEPMAGSTGVLVPPKGYLERLRAICSKHGILLIFDEVITGFGRLGSSFAAARFDVQPDMIVMAKGLTNGVIPMGAVAVSSPIHDAFMQGPEDAIELFHGYTYSGHPVAAAAAIASLDVYREESLFDRAAAMSDYFEDAAHSLRQRRGVIDVRNIGLVAGIELEPRGAESKRTTRAYDVFVKCFERGVLIRTTGEVIAVSPPLIAEKAHIDELFGTIGEVLDEVD